MWVLGSPVPGHCILVAFGKREPFYLLLITLNVLFLFEGNSSSSRCFGNVALFYRCTPLAFQVGTVIKTC